LNRFAVLFAISIAINGIALLGVAIRLELVAERVASLEHGAVH
jgi:hypothetical protein